MNGTGANVISLQLLLKPYQAVICAATAHIENDECGAPEKLLGSKLILVQTPDGKLTPELIAPYLKGTGDQHHVQARAVSITQSTELGTLYTLAELKKLAEWVHSKGMLLHMDGARISNAAVSLGCSLKRMTRDAGIDVLSFGGTKNGMILGEAVVCFRPELSEGLKFVRKQSMQLASKMRYVSAQFDAFFEESLWRDLAAHSNLMAQRLASGLSGIPGVELTQAVQANAVFPRMPRAMLDELLKDWYFYVWDEPSRVARLMCSFDTTESDVLEFVESARVAAGRATIET